MKETVLKKFEEIFGDIKDVNVYFAPGRVNMIGEHTDYRSEERRVGKECRL